MVDQLIKQVLHDLVVFAFGSLSMFVCGVLILRRVYRENSEKLIEFELELLLARKAILNMISHSHHYGGRPIFKTLDGLLDLARRLLKTIRELNVLLSRPNHHEYADQQRQDIDGLEEIVNKIANESLRLDKEIMSLTKKLEDMQL